VTAAELTCEEFVELVTDYLEGRMAPAERARFEEHLAICDGCQAYLEQMRETLAALGRLPEEELSDEARDALLAAFRDWKSAH
jgi:anti-sigma factor RsiW